MTIALLERNDVDRRIWNEELEEFVPQQVFDVHTHIYRWDFYVDQKKDEACNATIFSKHFREVSLGTLNAVDKVLMPGREVARLTFPFPFDYCDFEASNDYLAKQLITEPRSAGLLLVHPAMTEGFLEQQIEQYPFLGFKPYPSYSKTVDPIHCRIRDFLPEHQLAIADRHGLIVMLHLAKPESISDLENIQDLTKFCELYPRMKWILAHCARSYSRWSIDRVASTLKQLPNVWYDTSSVCESDAVESLCEAVGPERVMYGSDDIPFGVQRGKYIAFGYGWTFLSETNHSLSLSHCNPQMTFTRYEQLRAMRSACLRLGYSRENIQALFHDTAVQLIESVRQSPSQAT